MRKRSSVLGAAQGLIAIVGDLGDPRISYVFLVGIPKVEDGLAVLTFAGVVVVRSDHSIPEEIVNPKVTMFIVKEMEQVESLDAA